MRERIRRRNQKAGDVNREELESDSGSESVRERRGMSGTGVSRRLHRHSGLPGQERQKESSWGMDTCRTHMRLPNLPDKSFSSLCLGINLLLTLSPSKSSSLIKLDDLSCFLDPPFCSPFFLSAPSHIKMQANTRPMCGCGMHHVL